MKAKLGFGIAAIIVIVFAAWKIFDSTLNTPETDTGSVISETEKLTDFVSDGEILVPDDVDESFLEEMRGIFPQSTLVAGDVEAKPGEDVVIQVLMLNNPSVLGMCITVSYDENVVILQKVESGTAFSDDWNFTSSGSLNSGCRFMWDGIDVSSDQVKDGTLMKMTFKCKNSASKGKYPVIITLDEDGAVDQDLNLVDFQLDSCFITIE